MRRLLQGCVAAGLAMLAAFAACADEDDGWTVAQGGGGATTSSGGQGGAGGLTGPTVQITLKIEDAINETPLGGAEICILDYPIDCTHSDAEGVATIIAPAGTPVWASCTREGYLNALVGAVTTEEDLVLTAPLLGATLAPTIASMVGVELDPTKGQVVVAAAGYPEPGKTRYPPFAGVTCSLTPPPEAGPFYSNEHNIPDPSLTETSEGGGALLFNVEPGVPTTLWAAHGSEPCGPFLAHPTGAPDTYDVRVLPDFVTYVSIICGEPAAGGGGAGGAGAAGGAGGAGAAG